MTREELKEHCIKQIEQCKMWAIHRGEEPSGKVYEEHKLILELLEQEPCEDDGVDHEKIRKVFAKESDIKKADIADMVTKVIMQAEEETDRFIFNTIRPYCEGITQQEISKEILSEALTQYFSKPTECEDVVSRKAVLDEAFEVDTKEYGRIDVVGVDAIDALPSVTIRQSEKKCVNCKHLDTFLCVDCKAENHWEQKEVRQTCSTCKHYMRGERDGSCDSYVCQHYSDWEGAEDDKEADDKHIKGLDVRNSSREQGS